MSPVKVDMHIHIYPSAEIGLADKEYEIWEYGKHADVCLSRCAGTVSELLESMQSSGISKGVVLIYFMGRWRRQAAIGSSKPLTNLLPIYYSQSFIIS